MGRVKLAKKSFAPEVQRALFLGDRCAEVTSCDIAHGYVTHFLNASGDFTKGFGGNSQLALLVRTKSVH